MIVLNYTTTAISFILSGFALYTALFGRLSAILQRGVFLGLVMVLGYLVKPMKKDAPKWTKAIDCICALASAVCTVYIVYAFQDYQFRVGLVNHWDTFFGLLYIALLLELCRRVIGAPLLAVCLAALAYGFWGNLLPGFYSHTGYTANRIASTMILSTSGIFGSAMAAAATFVAIFMLFGSFLEETGGSQAFMDFTTAIAGKYRGGPAKIAVLASALTGTISGSPVANVTTTGVFTIPLMKKVGYEPKTAGAVEAVASSGGSILPPVMGSGAFIMSEMAGIAYSAICLASAIPAIIYYCAIYFVVDFTAAKQHLGRVAEEDMKSIHDTLKKSLMFFIPLTVLIFTMLVLKYTIIKSAMYGIIAIIISSYFTKDHRITPKVFVKMLISAAKKMILVTIACGSSGIVVGIISLTGLGLKLSGTLLDIGANNLLLTLMLCMLGAIIISMGLPSTPGYIVFSVLTVPALTQLGVPLLAAHLFIYYYCCFAPMTPPVAIASYAAAGISGANPMGTSLQAFRFVIPAFIIPYFFIYAPEIMGSGTALAVIQATLTGILGVLAFAAGNVGWLIENLKWIERIVVTACGISCVIPGTMTDLLGVAGVLLIAGIHIVHKRTEKKSVE